MKIKKTAAIIMAAASMGVSPAAPYSAAMPVMPVYAVEETAYSFEEMAEKYIKSGDADGVYESFLYKKCEGDNGDEYLSITGADLKIKEVTIPAEIEGIKVREIDGAFNECNELEAVVISDGITTIKDRAFSYCTNLKYISIPKSVIHIDESAFYGCDNIETVELCTPDLNDIYGEEKNSFLFAINDISTEGNMYYYLDQLITPSLKKLIIKDGSKFVPKIKYATQEMLDSLEIPESVTVLFGASGDFESVTIPKNIEYIADGAFMKSKNLKKVNFEEGFKGNIGDSAFGMCDSIEELDIPSGVTVESRAFTACNGLKSVSLPLSWFTTTEENDNFNSFPPFFNAFYNSNSLEKITLKDDPEGNTVFKGYGYYLFSSDFFPALKTICLPDSITEIGEDTFWDADSIETVKLPANLEKIGEGAFRDCKSLKEINIPQSVTEIGNAAFIGCKSLKEVTIPSGITEIKSNTFYGCNNLQKINIPDSVTVIGEGAFGECDSLEEIKLPEGIKEIGGGAFFGCNSLKEIVIPDGKKIIHDGAFSNCAALEKADIGIGTEFDPVDWLDEENNTVYSKNLETFSDCDNLREVSVPHSMFINKETVFESTVQGNGTTHFKIKNTVIDHPFYDSFINCKKLETINIKLDPDAEKVIDEQKIYNFPSLKKINIPEGIEEIGKNAFKFYPLETIELPESLRVIGEGAFYSCNSLKNIRLPKSVKSIGEYAFDCFNLKEITILNPKCEIGDGAIWANGDIVTIYGYKGSTAEKYAEGSEELIFIPLDGDESTVIGDANLDGEVTLSDALLILQNLANERKYPMSDQAKENADVFSRGDGMTAMDALTIQKYDAKLITTLPESYNK